MRTPTRGSAIVLIAALCVTLTGCTSSTPDALVNGQPNDALRQGASDLSSAITRGDHAKLQHLAAGGTDLSFIGPLAAAYRGSKIEVVGFDSDSGGEAGATFRVRCPSGRTVSFQAGFVFDGKRWAPALGLAVSTTTNDYGSPALSDTPTLDAGSASVDAGTSSAMASTYYPVCG